MAFRRRRKRNSVYYLQSNTYGIQQTQAGPAMNGANTSAVNVLELIAGTTDQPLDEAQAAQFTRQGPTAEPDIIIESITGQLYWSINGKPSGVTAASGVAALAIRAMIFTTPELPNFGNASMAVPLAGGSQFHLNAPDINAAADDGLWFAGSRAAAGWRNLWSKTWYASVDFGSQSQLNCGSFDPPSSWIHCKPRKRLRVNERLWAAVQYSAINLNSFAGQTQIILAPSLRVAAKRAFGRRF